MDLLHFAITLPIQIAISKRSDILLTSFCYLLQNLNVYLLQRSKDKDSDKSETEKSDKSEKEDKIEKAEKKSKIGASDEDDSADNQPLITTTPK